jgi:hypothetical protein
VIPETSMTYCHVTLGQEAKHEIEQLRGLHWKEPLKYDLGHDFC